MMRNNTIEAFFALVKSGLFGGDTRLGVYEALDFEELLELASEQRVVGLVAAGIEMVEDLMIPQPVLRRFIGRTVQIERRNKKMNIVIAALVAKMRQVGIYAILVKGQGIAQCYNKPLWRTSGDIDLFLSEENYNKAKAFLTPYGKMTEPELTNKKHFAIEINGWSIELHGTLHCGLSSRADHVIDNVQDAVLMDSKVRSWMNGDTQVFLPAIDEDVIFVFSHILQHFYKGGIGLRQICDWCRLLWESRLELDIALLEKRLRKMALMSEWKAFGMFAVEYLGMPAEAMPLYVNNTHWRRKAQRIMRFVIEVGDFGHNRDISHYGESPYLIRKARSGWQRVKDVFWHAAIFPVDSFRFMIGIMINGFRDVARGE